MQLLASLLQNFVIFVVVDTEVVDVYCNKDTALHEEAFVVFRRLELKLLGDFSGLDLIGDCSGFEAA